jgi:tetratricopeptide (TPR) repeat protein
MQDALAGRSHALTIGEKVRGLALLALALGKMGEADQGLEKIDEALALAKQAKKFGDFYLLYLFKGQLLLMKNAAGLRKAKQCFSTALGIARDQNAKSDELRAATPLAKLMAQQGRRSRHV